MTRERDLLDRAGWAVTKVLRWIGAVFIAISLLGAAAAAIQGKWGLAGGLLLNALFQAFAFAAAIAIGTVVFAPRDANSQHGTDAP